MAGISVAPPNLTLDNLGSVVLRQRDSDAAELWGGQVIHGRSGAPVTELQAALIAIGTLTSSPDGQFGPQTTQALERFHWHLSTMQVRLDVPAGTIPASGTISPHPPRQFAVTGVCDATTASELLDWISGNFITTTPLVRLNVASLSNIRLADAFTRLNYPGVSAGEILVNTAFTDIVKTLNGHAQNLNVTLMINQTFRRNDVAPGGAVVPPARNSQHFIGHAVDLDIVDNGTVNTFNLFQSGRETPGARRFIAAVKAGTPAIRWGGDFAQADYVHFDDFVDPASQAYDMHLLFAQRCFHLSHPMRLTA